MDYFCESCAKKPGWPFDKSEGKVFNHSCQRCFQYRPCNDYGKKEVKVEPAPAPQEIKTKDEAAHIDVALPKATGKLPPPVRTPVPHTPGTPTEADKALDAVQPNRQGIKLSKIAR